MTTTAKAVTFLVVDDSAPMALVLQESLKRIFHCRVITAFTGREALDCLEQEAIALVITSCQICDMSGIALATQVRRLRPDVAIILITGYLSSQLRNQATRLAIHHILTKPVGLFQLREAALELLQDRAEKNGLPFDQEAVVIETEEITQAMERWISQQIRKRRPDFRTREVLDLLDQWESEENT